MDAGDSKPAGWADQHDLTGARRMAGLIDDQHAQCVELESLSRAQSAMVEGGDTDGVLDVLGRRQVIIDRITRLSEELVPLRSGREQMLAALPPTDRDRLRASIEEIARLVERVRLRDEQDREAIERRRASLAGELSGLTRARGAVAAYSGGRAGAGGGTGGSARFQDRQG